MRPTIAILALLVATQAIAQEKKDENPLRRTWADKTGTHKIEATMSRISESAVYLVRPDGKEVSVPFDKLDRESLLWLTRFLAVNFQLTNPGPKNVPANPFEPGKKPAASEPMAPKQPAKAAATSPAAKRSTLRELLEIAEKHPLGDTDAKRRRASMALAKKLQDTAKKRPVEADFVVENVFQEGNAYFATGHFDYGVRPGGTFGGLGGGGIGFPGGAPGGVPGFGGLGGDGGLYGLFGPQGAESIRLQMNADEAADIDPGDVLRIEGQLVVTDDPKRAGVALVQFQGTAPAMVLGLAKVSMKRIPKGQR